MIEDEEPSELESTGFIACKACGARIRANREACLRCGEPLEAAPPLLTLSTISSGRPLIVALAIAAGLAALVVVFWINRPTSEDQPAQVYTRAGAAPAASARPATSGQPPSPATPSAPAADDFLDLPETADVDLTDLSASRAQLEARVEQSPSDPVALNNLGLVLMRQGDAIAATPRFEHAIQNSPNEAAYHANLANAFSKQGQWNRVVGEYRQALELAPNDMVVQFNIAVALHKMGDDVSAIPMYELAMRLAPGDARFHAALAASLEKVGNVENARQELQKYLDMAPTGAYAASVAARLKALSEAGQPATP
jgi:Flp pilus assembly protein TadD